jgi:hypothetical protein
MKKMLTNTICIRIYNKKGESIILAIKPFKVVICSDDGAKEDNGGFGLVVSVNNDIIIRNKQRLSEIAVKYSSHCSEAMGVLNAIN